VNTYFKKFLVGLAYGSSFLIAAAAAFGPLVLLFVAGPTDTESTNWWLIILAVAIWLVFGAALYALPDDEKEKLVSGHKCDLCGDQIKKHEGLHFKTPGSDSSCYCLCPACAANAYDVSGAKLLK